MSDDTILRLGMSPEELEDTIQFSQQMVQVLLETIGESLADADHLRTENRALRAALEQAGLPLPEVPVHVVPVPVEAPEELEAPAAEFVAVTPAPAAPVPEPVAIEAAPVAPEMVPLDPPEAVQRDPRLGDGVLIVDDSRILQMRLRSLIEPMGIHIVGYAGDGAEGVRLALALNPRVVILDYHMPEMNGLEAVKILQRDAPQIRLIVCTAELTASTSRELLAAGCTEVLTKPIQLDHFVRALKRCVDERPLSAH